LSRSSPTRLFIRYQHPGSVSAGRTGAIFFTDDPPHARVIPFWKNQNEKGPPWGTTAAPHQMSAASIGDTGGRGLTALTSSHQLGAASYVPVLQRSSTGAKQTLSGHGVMFAFDAKRTSVSSLKVVNFEQTRRPDRPRLVLQEAHVRHPADRDQEKRQLGHERLIPFSGSDFVR
jgi:hypothetical protein